MGVHFLDLGTERPSKPFAIFASFASFAVKIFTSSPRSNPWPIDDRFPLERNQGIVKGGADKSYGIHVARLAALPPEVIVRAEEILEHLEASQQPRQLFSPTKAPPSPSREVQLTFSS